MIEQLNLFGERDEIYEVAEWIMGMYEDYRKRMPDGKSFMDWIEDEFSSFHGGSYNTPLGYTFWSFDHSGFRLVDTSVPKGESYKEAYFPKHKIMKACGVKK